MSAPAVVLSKRITYCGAPAMVGCDARCDKAWGIATRPRVQFGDLDDFDGIDDYAYLSDDELGEAPADPGTYEGRDGKPNHPDDRLNKWCVRQCERSVMTEYGKTNEPLVLPDFSRRVYNMPDSPGAQADLTAQAGIPTQKAL